MQHDRLHAAMVRRINAWQISPRAKAVAIEINDLSFGEGLDEVELWQWELCALTGLGKACISKAIAELKTEGVLQVRGIRGDIHAFRLLPNAEMIQPEARPDLEQASVVRASIRTRNKGHRLGEGPRGQMPLLKTAEDRLQEDQATASAESALEDDAKERAMPPPGWTPDLTEQVRRSIAQAEESSCLGGNSPVAQEETRGGQLPARKLNPVACQETRPGPEPRASPRARNVNVDGTRQRNVDVVTDVGRVPNARFASEEVDARFAFELVREVADPGEFKAWESRWWERCRKEPNTIAEAAAEVRARKLQKKGKPIRNGGATVFRIAKGWLEAIGRTLKLL